jgi:hypothetical protein
MDRQNIAATPPMDIHDGDEWSEMDIFDLKNSLAHGNSGSWWNRVGDFWLESAKKAGIAGGFCILKVAIFGMNSGWHEHRNAAGGYGIRIRSQAFARSRRCAEFSVIRRRA